jgi:CRISPR-associated endoribonuclease Cas6
MNLSSQAASIDVSQDPAHPYLRLVLRVRPVARTEPAEPLPAALVRRVLGKAFVDVFCPFGQPRCQASRAGGSVRAAARDLCGLAELCPYGVLFAASKSPRPPFALYTASEEDGNACLLELTLLGAAWPFYPWALASLARAFDLGLGHERRRWQVDEVFRVRAGRVREALCGHDLARLSSTLTPEAVGLGLAPSPTSQPVEIRLLSPARLLQKGRLLPGRAPVPFELLIARILDRFAGLFGEGSSKLLGPALRPALEAEAADVPLLVDETEWLEVRDYSARSNAEMLLGGKVGRLVYGPEAARFLPVLRAGEILHVGKNPAAGCGRIEVTAPAEDVATSIGSAPARASAASL